MIQLGLQNAGGHRAHEVFHFCRANPGLVPSFGKRVMAAPYHWSKLKRLPGTSRMLPGDVRHLNVNTTYFKNAVSTALRIAPGDPGGISLYCEFPEDYTKHLTAEYLGEDGYWECPPPGRDNHLFDCLVLNFVAGDIIGLKHKPSNPPPRR